MTIYHYDHPALKSKLLDNKCRLNGINSHEYIKDIMEKIERGEKDRPGYKSEEEDEWFNDDDSYYK